MSQKVLIPLIDGFEEIEAVTSIDILRRAGLEVITAGIGGLRITGSHRIQVGADVLFEDVVDEEFDAIVLPGGPGTQQLIRVAPLQQMLKRHAERGKLVAAICAAPTILAAAGLLEGVETACFPSGEGQLGGAILVREPVAVSGKIITSRGAGTAVAFALEVTAALLGREEADKLARSIVYQTPG